MRIVKRLLVVTLAVLLILSVGCSNGNKTEQKADNKTQSTEKEPYVLGAVLDITGTNASLGTPERDSILMKVKEINDQGGINGHKIDLKIYDNGSDETKSLMLTKKMISDDKVLAFVGPSVSGTGIAMAKIAEESQVPMVAVAQSVKIVSPPETHKYAFKSPVADPQLTERLTEYLKKNNLIKVAWLSQNNAMGDTGLAELQKSAAKNGIQIVSIQKFEATDTDATTQLTKIKAANPDAILSWSIPPGSGVVAKNYHDLGLKVPIFFNQGNGTQAFIKLAGEAAEGLYVITTKLVIADQLPDSDILKPVLLKYIDDYEKKNNYGPVSNFGGNGYDAFCLVLDALKRAGDNPDRAKIRDELEKTTNFLGVTGVYNMSPTDHTGLTAKDMVIVKIVNGKWQLVD
ncbi:MAG: ABC transporter substrate-binding protein [Thermincola sp.]|nr:ABC transporter substrate-binding protein [Thermincola sp.]MDT3704931.1 ABC transporter substrate-binding protein [Thermincola sp.]